MVVIVTSTLPYIDLQQIDNTSKLYIFTQKCSNSIGFMNKIHNFNKIHLHSRYTDSKAHQ